MSEDEFGWETSCWRDCRSCCVWWLVAIRLTIIWSRRVSINTQVDQMKVSRFQITGVIKHNNYCKTHQHYVSQPRTQNQPQATIHTGQQVAWKRWWWWQRRSSHGTSFHTGFSPLIGSRNRLFSQSKYCAILFGGRDEWGGAGVAADSRGLLVDM